MILILIQKIRYFGMEERKPKDVAAATTQMEKKRKRTGSCLEAVC
jgi:hypothetical protein